MRIGTGIFIVLALVGMIPFGVGAQDTLEEIRFSVERYEIIGENPIGELADNILAPYIGEQYGLEGLSAARDALEQAIIEAGFNFHRVSLPPQDLFEGTVRLKISRFAIGRVLVEGNEFFDEENIKASVPELRQGETPNTRLLSRSLKIANRHASKSTVLRFREGEAADTIDAVLDVQDRDPSVYFVSLDNTGPEDGEEWRMTLGYQNGNLFNRDHSLTATYTTAPGDTDETQQFGLSYHIPMYKHGASLDILFSDSDSAGETGGEDDAGQSIAPGTGGGQALEFTGEGTVFGAVYNRPLLTDGSFSHEWSAGLQHKTFNNKQEFLGNQICSSGAPTCGEDLLSIPVEIGYSFNRQSPNSSFFGSITLVQEIGDDDSGYEEEARSDSEAGWNALRFNVTYDRLFAESYLFHVGFSGQQTSAILISGEQFGVGGAGTLRGFQERSVIGDSGYQMSLELWFPPLSKYNFRFLLFTDFASIENNDGQTPGFSESFSSAGGGMFWAWKDNFSLSMNYGVITEAGDPDVSVNDDGDDKLHLSAVYRF